jgi:hypothetical protein
MNVLSESLMSYQEKGDYAQVPWRSLTCPSPFVYLVNHNNPLTESELLSRRSNSDHGGGQDHGKVLS